MILKTLLLLFTCSITIFAQNNSDQIILPGKEYRAGTRIQNAYRGVSFIIPRDWKGAMPPDQRVFLMSSHVRAGVGLAIFQSAVSKADIVQYLKQSQNLGDNVILKPVGEPKINGTQISMEYTSMTNSGYALALKGPHKNTVVFLFAGLTKDKEYFKKLVEKLNSSVLFSIPDPSKLSAAWANALYGKMLKKVSVDDSEGAFPTVVHLCKEGKVQVSIPGKAIDLDSAPTLIDGTWKVKSEAAQAYLVLTPSRGKTVRASLDVFGSYVILQGGRYFLTTSDVCK
ncbi:MAG: hypothetical protein KAJ16_10405 [Calditrichia bacterium]|nr:hypothetical protein [Calditrichia bacterium]